MENLGFEIQLDCPPLEEIPPVARAALQAGSRANSNTGAGGRDMGRKPGDS